MNQQPSIGQRRFRRPRVNRRTAVRRVTARAAGVVDVGKSDALARLRTQTRELLAANQRLTAGRDFLKKAAAYFAAPSGDDLK